jgi:hypothetical protein
MYYCFDSATCVLLEFTGRWVIKKEFVTWIVPGKGFFTPVYYDGEYRYHLLLETKTGDWLPDNRIQMLEGGDCNET